jgi:hypothetical protein
MIILDKDLMKQEENHKINLNMMSKFIKHRRLFHLIVPVVLYLNREVIFLQTELASKEEMDKANTITTSDHQPLFKITRKNKVKTSLKEAVLENTGHKIHGKITIEEENVVVDFREDKHQGFIIQITTKWKKLKNRNYHKSQSSLKDEVVLEEDVVNLQFNTVIEFRLIKFLVKK